MSNFWQHCPISALQISKKHFVTFDFFVKMKLASTVSRTHKRPLSKSGYCEHYPQFFDCFLSTCSSLFQMTKPGNTWFVNGSKKVHHLSLRPHLNCQLLLLAKNRWRHSAPFDKRNSHKLGSPHWTIQGLLKKWMEHFTPSHFLKLQLGGGT